MAAALIDSSPVAAAVNRGGDRPGVPAAGKVLAGVEFALEGPGLALGNFSRCLGLFAGVEVVEFRDANEPSAVHKVPGSVLYPEFTVQRPLNGSMAAAAWLQMVLDGEIGAATKDCSLAVISPNGGVVARYELENAWPANVEVGAVIVDGTEMLIESLTVACESITRVAP